MQKKVMFLGSKMYSPGIKVCKTIPSAFVLFVNLDHAVNSYVQSNFVYREFDRLLIRYVNFATDLRYTIDEERSDRGSRKPAHVSETNKRT